MPAAAPATAKPEDVKKAKFLETKGFQTSWTKDGKLKWRKKKPAAETETDDDEDETDEDEDEDEEPAPKKKTSKRRAAAEDWTTAETVVAVLGGLCAVGALAAGAWSYWTSRPKTGAPPDETVH